MYTWVSEGKAGCTRVNEGEKGVHVWVNEGEAGCTRG